MQLKFEDMLALAEAKPELRAKEEVVAGRTVTIFTYMVAFADTFDTPLAREFRGTTFDNETKECICRPFRKFFNVGECAESRHDRINWDKAQFFTKHDGSMITPVLIDGEVYWKTKKSFFSDVAIKAAAYAKRNADKIIWLQGWKEHLHKDFTPIYEYVGPGNQIVLPYEEEKFIFLGMNNLITGEWCPAPELKVDITYDEIMGMEQLEGFVICDGNDLYKAKTTWYCERHKICSEYNPKTIINATLNDTIDDMLGTIAQLGLMLRYYQVNELRNKVVTEQLFVEDQIKFYFNMLESQNLETRKDQALFINTPAFPQEFRGIMFKMLDGKDISEQANKIVFERIYSEVKDAEEVE